MIFALKSMVKCSNYSCKVSVFTFFSFVEDTANDPRLSKDELFLYSMGKYLQDEDGATGDNDDDACSDYDAKEFEEAAEKVDANEPYYRLGLTEDTLKVRVLY